MTTVRELARHVRHDPPPSFTVRELVRRSQGAVSLQMKRAPFSLMTQNMALLPEVAYLGRNRDGAIREIIKDIQELAPDVVGLCEVWSDDEKDKIFNDCGYASQVRGPGDFPENGGLLLMSKTVPIATHDHVYEDSAGLADSNADKGILHMRVQPPNAPRAYEIFYSHNQDIDVDGGREVLKKQFTAMNRFIHTCVDSDNPVFVMGDLNMPGEISSDYDQLISRLRNPVDLWLVSGGAPKGGLTFVSDNIFYADEDDKEDDPAKINRRLDYILMRPGLKTVPILKSFEIVKFTFGSKVNGRQPNLSDHFGLRAVFEQSVQVVF
jgi:hypothetical protein